VRIDPDHILDLGPCLLRIGLGQVHLVQHRQHFDAQLDGRVAVGHRLRFDALRGVDHQQSTFARRQRAADLVREIDVARRVDQIQVVDLPVARAVAQGGGLRFDRDAALAFQVHRIEHLFRHLPIRQAAAALNQPIGQRRFTVVDVRDDRKIADVLHSNAVA